MQRTQPNYSADDLAQISVPVVIVQSEHDEFIKREHAEYLARSIPNAEFVFLPGVSHFAPLQRPEQFNTVMLAFLDRIMPKSSEDSGADNSLPQTPNHSSHRSNQVGRFILGRPNKTHQEIRDLD